MAISACGYVAVRALGARFGLPAAGLASGFVSSSATIAAMGARVIEDSRLLGPAVAGAVLSTIATVAQVAIVVAATSSITLMALGLPLIFAGLAAVAYGLIFGLRLTDTTPISLAKPEKHSVSRQRSCWQQPWPSCFWAPQRCALGSATEGCS